MTDKRFIATCKCPVCGHTATFVGRQWLLDLPVSCLWGCPNCDLEYPGNRKGIDAKAAWEFIEENDLGICATCHAPFGPEYEGQKICRVCEREHQPSLFQEES